MPEDLDLDTPIEIPDESEVDEPKADTLSSPQRRMIGDFQAKKSLEKLRDRLGETSGEYHDDAPEKGPSFFTEPIGPMGHHITVSFKNGKTVMKMNAKGKEDTIVVFMEKLVDGYNVDSAVRFIKQAQRIIAEIHAMY
jgi:hypothetical protein